MQKVSIPVAFRQILYLAVTIVLPLVFAVAAIYIAPPKAGQTVGDDIAALTIVGVVALGLAAILLLALRRRAVEVTADRLIVKHSLYTYIVQRADVTSVSVREISSLDQLGLSTRKNGIAAFGYLSGWFSGVNGDLTFCAISTKPIYLVRLEGKLKCCQLALSANPEIIASIQNWIH